jgi:Protein of unknown function
MQDDDTLPDRADSRQRFIDQLAPALVAEIDRLLLANCHSQWLKVARVVGSAMQEMRGKIDGVPDVYFAQRIAHLVQAGKLVSQGDLKRMRFSEVRIP